MVDPDSDGGGEVLITLVQAAMWLGRTPRTLQRWVAKGALEARSTPQGAMVRPGDAARAEKEQRARQVAPTLPRWRAVP